MRDKRVTLAAWTACAGTPAVEADFFKWTQSTTSGVDRTANLPDEPGCSDGNDPFAIQGGYDLVVAVKPDDENFVVIGGTNAADFTVTAQPSASIAAGASTSFTVSFNPGAAGTRSATVSIANDDANENPYNFSIQGTGTAVSEINVLGNAVPIVDGDATPSTADHTDFGGAKLELGAVTRTFTIRNTGTGALTFPGTPRVAISGANAGDFTVTSLPTASTKRPCSGSYDGLRPCPSAWCSSSGRR